MIFLICLEELHSLEAPNSFVFQLQLEGGYNLKESPTLQSLATTRRRLQPPMFSGYNRKVANPTCPCPVQQPWSRSKMMEPLSHYHSEIYHCKSVPINLNHESTIHQPIPQLVINLYHKQVHQPCTNLYQITCTINKCIQPCTKYVPIMCQLLINYDSSICTNISTIHLMYVPTHQLLVSTMYSTCTSTKIPHQFHHPNLICSS